MNGDPPLYDPHRSPYPGPEATPPGSVRRAPHDPDSADDRSESAAPAPLADATERDGSAAFPWPPRDDAGVLAAFARTWQESTFQPKRFFAGMPVPGSLGAALLYYLPLGVLIAGGNLFWSTVRGTAVEQDSVLEPLGGAAAAMNPLVSFLLSPLILLLSLFISAAVTHLLLKMFGTARGGFGTSARVFAFAYSPQLFSLVPVIGMPIAVVWMLVISIVGLREAHRTTTGVAAAAVLIPAVIALFFLAVVLFLTAAGSLLL